MPYYNWYLLVAPLCAWAQHPDTNSHPTSPTDSSASQSLYFLYEGDVVISHQVWLLSFAMDLEPFEREVQHIVDEVTELNEELKGVTIDVPDPDHIMVIPLEGTPQEETNNMTKVKEAAVSTDTAYRKSLELFKMEAHAHKGATSRYQL